MSTIEKKLQAPDNTYAADQSICRVSPKKVFIPETTKEIQELVQYVLEHEYDNPAYSITVRAGGTCMSGGPLNEGIIVDVSKNLTRIGEYVPEDHTLEVEGGTWYRDVEEHLEKKDRMFAPYTSSKDICSIGGMVGNNASGEKSFRYGATRDNVHSVSMVCGDGDEYTFGPLSTKELGEKMNQNNFEGDIYCKLHKLYTEHADVIKKEIPSTKKNTAGYALNTIYDAENDTWNLAKLIVGSQGTLGVITGARLHTAPIAKHTALYAIPISSFENVPDVLEDVANNSPETIEVYDQTTLRLSCKSDPTIKKNLEHLLEYKAVLLVQYAEETRQALKEKQEAFEKACASHKLLFEFAEGENEECHWQTRRNSYGLFRDNATKGRPVPLIEDISVHRKDLDKLFDDIDDIMKKYEYEYVFHGHIGDASIRVFPLVDFDKKDAKENLYKMAEEVFAVVLGKNGTISTDHGDGIVRTPFLPMMYEEKMRSIFQEIKDAFDPKNIFNPGKKLSVTKEYFLEHIRE